MQAGGSGGAVWISTLNGLVTSNHTKISANTAAAAGGGIWFHSPDITFLQLNSTTFSNNAAGVSPRILQEQLDTSAAAAAAADTRGWGESATAGRHLLQDASSTAPGTVSKELIQLAQGSLPGASAAEAEALVGSGGAVGAAGSINVYIVNVKMAKNSAGRSGGGLYCHACLSVNLIKEKTDRKVIAEGGSEWVGNSAGASGGALATYMLKGASQIQEASFINNTAGEQRGYQGATSAVPVLNSSTSTGTGGIRLFLGPCGVGGGGALCLQTLSEKLPVRKNKLDGNVGRFGGKTWDWKLVIYTRSGVCGGLVFNAALCDSSLVMRFPLTLLTGSGLHCGVSG